MKYAPLLAALVLTCTLSACKKDEEKPKSRAELLTAHEWIMTAAVGTIGAYTFDFMNDPVGGIQACAKDDIYAFTPAGTYAFSEGATSCSPPKADAGSWSLNADDSKLTLTSQSRPVQTLDVVELSDNVLKLSAIDNSYNATMITTVTYSKR